MDEGKRELKGSEKLDEFKRRHKDLSGQFYATDGDLCLISKYPPGTVAYIDYKADGDNVTFAEAIQYNEWMKLAPVYIIQGDNPEMGPFTITRYLGADWRPEPPVVNYGDSITVSSWPEFGEWESSLRAEYRRRGGWQGYLRTEP